MPTNVTEFNRQLEAATKDMSEVQLTRFQLSFALEAFRRINLRNPVDTGRSRGNWQIGIEDEPRSIIEDFLGDRVTPEIAKLTNLQPYQMVWITNNVNYIWYLEYTRRSPKSPDGMVEITLQELLTEIGGMNEFRGSSK